MGIFSSVLIGGVGTRRNSIKYNLPVATDREQNSIGEGTRHPPPEAIERTVPAEDGTSDVPSESNKYGGSEPLWFESPGVLDELPEAISLSSLSIRPPILVCDSCEKQPLAGKILASLDLPAHTTIAVKAKQKTICFRVAMNQ